VKSCCFKHLPDIRKGKITGKFQSLNSVLGKYTKGFVTREVSGRSKNGEGLTRENTASTSKRITERWRSICQFPSIFTVENSTIVNSFNTKLSYFLVCLTLYYFEKFRISLTCWKTLSILWKNTVEWWAYQLTEKKFLFEIKPRSDTFLPGGCKSYNGHCLQQCHDTKSGHYCSCNAGYKLMDDKKSCEGKLITSSYIEDRQTDRQTDR